MDISVLFALTGFTALSVASYRLLLLKHRERRATDIPLLVISFSLGLSFVFLSPVTQIYLSQLVPSFGRLLSNIFTLITAFGFLHLMLFISYPAEQIRTRARLPLILLIISIAVMAVTFFASELPNGVGTFGSRYKEQSTLVVYIVAYSSYLGFTGIHLGILALKLARYTRSWFRYGMILISIGCLLTVIYLAEKLSYVFLSQIFDFDQNSSCRSSFSPIRCVFPIVLPALSAISMSLGVALPTIGTKAEALYRRARDARAFKNLEPLWEALSQHIPHVNDVTVATPTGEVSERLYTRIIQIRDALLVISLYRRFQGLSVSTQVKARFSFAVSRQKRKARIEALHILEALQQQVKRTLLPSEEVKPVPSNQGSLPQEISWLVLVSKEIRRYRKTRPTYIASESLDGVICESETVT